MNETKTKTKSVHLYAGAVFATMLAAFCAVDFVLTHAWGSGWWTEALPCLSFPAALAVWRAMRHA
jgi:hypothetical protein